VMPNSVNVTGDPSALAMFNVVETGAFDISGATSDRTGEVDLVLPNGVEATLTKVRVTVNIERAR
jgi:YbbR domain-containing protein